MHLVCTQCEAINRVKPESSDTQSLFDAKCGRCKQAIYQGLPVNLNDTNFFRFIEKNETPIVVDFWADWCGPCKSMAPTFESVAKQSEGILFAKVDTQHSPNISSQAGIRSIPTLIYFHRSQEVDRVSGALNQHQLKQWIAQCINK